MGRAQTVKLLQPLSLICLIGLTIGLALVTRHRAAAAVNPNQAWFDPLAGGAPLITLTLGWEYTGDGTGDTLGYAVGAAGDVNGDLVNDVIVGAPKDTAGIGTAGAAYVFYGSRTAAGLSAEPTWTAGGEHTGSGFGASVSTAGDVNHDGFSDVIIGAPDYHDDQSEEGRVYLFLGSGAGLAITPTWTITGGQKDAQFGYAVASAGDVNGDDYDDIIVGARRYSNGQSYEGRVYLFYGAASGPASSPDWTAEIDRASAAFGSAVGSAGDVNGDGYDDVIVGAPGYDDNPAGEGGGAVFVYYGSELGLSTTPNWAVIGHQAGARLGVSVGAAGDVNHDGFADVIAGAPGQDLDQADVGAAFIFYGSGSGLSQVPNRTISAGQSGSGFGIGVAAAGDVNNDHYDDVIVGAEFYSFNSENSKEGAAFLYLGSACGLCAEASWLGEGRKAESGFGHAVGAAGDVNGDDVADIIVGAPGYRVSTEIREAGRADVYYGLETDGSGVACQVFLPVILK